MRPGSWSTILLALVLHSGCGSPQADPDDPAAAPPGVLVVPPRLEPPPARERGLSREGVVRVAQAHPDPGDAIVELDARPFLFVLDAAALEWLGQRGLDPAVLDYLEKRAAVDWEALRGDVDPDAPPPR